jgi:hypothetical protein
VGEGRPYRLDRPFASTINGLRSDNRAQAIVRAGRSRPAFAAENWRGAGNREVFAQRPARVSVLRTVFSWPWLLQAQPWSVARSFALVLGNDRPDVNPELVRHWHVSRTAIDAAFHKVRDERYVAGKPIEHGETMLAPGALACASAACSVHSNGQRR